MRPVAGGKVVCGLKTGSVVLHTLLILLRIRKRSAAQVAGHTHPAAIIVKAGAAASAADAIHKITTFITMGQGYRFLGGKGLPAGAWRGICGGMEA